MVLVADLMKSLRDHLARSSGTGADAWSTMEMVDPDTGEIISTWTAQRSCCSRRVQKREKHEATSRMPSYINSYHRR
jgi:hypothetical protein